jgi:hypothetical protein
VLTSDTWVIAGAEPTVTTSVTGTGFSGKYWKCTVTASHVKSTPVTMCADAGMAMITPVITQIAIAPAKTVMRRLMDFRIRALRERLFPATCELEPRSAKNRGA